MTYTNSLARFFLKSFLVLLGKVELENLPLKPNAFKYQGVPLQMSYGIIGKAKLEVPVKSFHTSPWTIQLDQIHAVFRPLNPHNDTDDIDDARQDLQSKLNALNAVETQWLATKKLDEALPFSSSYTNWLQYGSSLLSNILENLQLQVTNVHFRYEDNCSSDVSPFAGGIRLGMFKVESCDSNWVPGSTPDLRNSMKSFKTVEMRDLSLYWDSYTEVSFAERCTSPTDFVEGMSSLDLDHNFIVSPVSAKCKMKRDLCKVPTVVETGPRFICDVTCDEININLNEVSFQCKCINQNCNIENVFMSFYTQKLDQDYNRRLTLLLNRAVQRLFSKI